MEVKGQRKKAVGEVPSQAGTQLAWLCHHPQVTLDRSYSFCDLNITICFMKVSDRSCLNF